MVSAEGEHLEDAAATPTSASAGVPWPAELREVAESAVTVEYASLTAAGVPITVPVTPYLSENGSTVDVSTGVTYAAKAERARRNRKVALLFADSLTPSAARMPGVMVQGLATVRDRDLQSNTDRYVRVSMERVPSAYAGQPRWLQRRLAWYFARIWIQVTPTRILWWPDARLEGAPQEWRAPEGTDAPPSDPPPEGKPARGTSSPGPDWRGEASAASSFLMHDLTVVDQRGFPLVIPVSRLEQAARGFVFQAPSAIELPMEGPACLTAHTHDVPFSSQQNRTFVGRLVHRDDGMGELEVDRLIPHWSISSNSLVAALSFMRKGRQLRPRLAAECARRGQQPPTVRIPERT